MGSSLKQKNQLIEFVNWKCLFASVIATLGLFGLMALIGSFDPDWYTWRQATTYGDSNEAIRDGWLLQPWNTVSSFLFASIGVYILFLPYKKTDVKTTISSSFLIRFCFCLSLVIAGVGVAFHHMSLTFVGEVMDRASIFLLSAFILIYALRGKIELSSKWFLPSWIVVSSLLLVAMIFLPVISRYLFAALLVVGVILEYILNRKTKGFSVNTLYACGSVMVFGFIFWIMDKMKVFFSPYSWFQGHAVWHIMVAVACAVLYYHYSRESTKVDTQSFVEVG